MSFTSDTGGRTWHISEKVAGSGFTIRLSDITPEPLDLDYWIVLVENSSPEPPNVGYQVSNIEPYCGDGELYAGEECDDGNNISGDGCTSTCEVEEISSPPANEISQPATDEIDEIENIASESELVSSSEAGQVSASETSEFHEQSEYISDDTASASEPISIEGCIDPEAENYNPEATLDDSSCTYPEPESESEPIIKEPVEETASGSE